MSTNYMEALERQQEVAESRKSTSTNTETLALERPQSDKFLDLVEKVIVNKEVDADKLRVLVDLQIQLEDRQAEKSFDADMIQAQAEVRALSWDKVNTERNSRNVSYPKIDAMLRPIRLKYGFTQTWDSEPSPMADMMVVCCDVIHRSGHRRRYRLPMPIDNMGPKGGSGVMTKQQAVVSGSSYGIRKLASMIWDIPLLVDKDDNDGNLIRPTVSEPQAKILRELLERLPEARQQKALEYLSATYKQEIKAVEDIPSSRYKHAETTLARALNSEGKEESTSKATISDVQVVTLQESIESNGKSCKADFLKNYGIKRIGELSADKYTDALKWLDEQRRK
jgi:hypothetical protein